MGTSLLCPQGTIPNLCCYRHGCVTLALEWQQTVSIRKTKEGGQSQKKKVEKPQDGRQKSSQNIGNPHQMEDNKNPKGAAPKAPPCCLPFGKDFLCFASFPEPVLARFSTKFADSENSLPQGAFLKSLPEASYQEFFFTCGVF